MEIPGFAVSVLPGEAASVPACADLDALLTVLSGSNDDNDDDDEY